MVPHFCDFPALQSSCGVYIMCIRSAIAVRSQMYWAAQIFWHFHILCYRVFWSTWCDEYHICYGGDWVKAFSVLLYDMYINNCRRFVSHLHSNSNNCFGRILTYIFTQNHTLLVQYHQSVDHIPFLGVQDGYKHMGNVPFGIGANGNTTIITYSPSAKYAI